MKRSRSQTFYETETITSTKEAAVLGLLEADGAHADLVDALETVKNTAIKKKRM
jgi:hypothetical protein